MNAHGKSILTMRFFEETARKATIVHSIHPLVTLVVTLVYVALVVSGEKYSIWRILPFALYPFVMIPLAEIPVRSILKRTLIVLPLVMGIGIFNPVFDKNLVSISPDLAVNAGWFSLCTLVVKSVLAVLAALVLFAATGMERIAYALRILRVPKLIVLQLLLTFRYLSLFASIAARTMQAYTLRAPGHRGIARDAWGPLAGQLLMRSFDTAQNVYEAMILRGFEGEYHPGGRISFRFRDLVFGLVCISYCVSVSIIDLPLAIWGMMQGGLH